MEEYEPDKIRFDGLDECIIGEDQNGFYVYSWEKMMEYFQRETRYDRRRSSGMDRLQCSRMYGWYGIRNELSRCMTLKNLMI